MRRMVFATVLLTCLIAVSSQTALATIESSVEDALAMDSGSVGGSGGGLINGISDFASRFTNNISTAGLGGIVQTAFQMFSFLNPASETFTQWAERTSASEMVGKIILQILQYVSDWLGHLSDLLFGRVFALLMIYMDYSQLPQIKAEVHDLYHSIAKIAYILIGIVFMISFISLAATSFVQENGAKFTTGFGILCGSVVFCVFLINYFPNLLSGATGLTSGICNEVLGHKITGENVDYSVAMNIVQQPGIINNASSQAFNTLKQSVNNTVNTVTQNINDNYVKPVQNTINNALNNPIGTMTDSLKINAPALKLFTPSANQEVSATIRDQAVLYILKIIVSIGSISLALGLLCLKGIQLVSIFIMLFFAPLVLIFIILPKGYNIVLRYCTSILGLLTWPIVWAIMIKVYFLIKIALNANQASSIIGSVNFGMITDKSLLMVFMELALLTMTLSVSVIAGYIFTTSSIGNVAHMGGVLAAAPAAIGGFVGAASGVAAFGALAGKHGIGKALMHFTPHGGKFMSALQDDKKAGKGGGNNSLNYQRNILNGMASAVGNVGKTVQNIAAPQASSSGGSKPPVAAAGTTGTGA